LGTSERTPFTEADPANLDNRHRGQLAEIAFLRRATSLGLSITKPWDAGERYDFIARVENVCWRVQVKSVMGKSPSRGHYRIRTSGGTGGKGHTPYSAYEIDFLVAYLFPENLGYVFPASVVESRKMMCVVPGSKRSRFEQYREAWNLMKPIADPVAGIQGAIGGGAPT